MIKKIISALIVGMMVFAAGCSHKQQMSSSACPAGTAKNARGGCS